MVSKGEVNKTKIFYAHLVIYRGFSLAYYVDRLRPHKDSVFMLVCLILTNLNKDATPSLVGIANRICLKKRNYVYALSTIISLVCKTAYKTK